MNGRRTPTARWVALGLLVAALGIAAASCSRDGGGASTEIEGLGSSLTEIQRRAREEAELNLVIWPDYAHDSWARVFAQQTGCEVNATVGTTSDAMIGLLETARWDGVSASGDASGRLMRAREVAPVNPALIPNYEQIEEGVKDQPFNSLDGQLYGVPHGRAPNLLLFRTDVVPDDTDSWRVIWEDSRPYRGRLSIFDDPLSIADAAVYLKATRPGLGIDNPYELDEEQFQAALALLRRQAPRVAQYWTRDIAEQVESFRSGESVVGTTWPSQAMLLERENVPVKAVKPKEGTTGWSDTWMVYRDAEHPNCMYLWMDYVISPEAQAKAAEFFGQAPVNLAACELTRDPGHCTELHADDDEWWADVHYWTAPAADCGGDRGDVCKSHEDWAAAWATIKAGR